MNTDREGQGAVMGCGVVERGDVVGGGGEQDRVGGFEAASMGFTTRARGKFIGLRQTIRKRIGAKLKEIKEELRDRMRDPIAQSGRWLRAVAGG